MFYDYDDGAGFNLGGGCCVNVVEESLEIIAGKGAVHLFAGP